MTEDARRWRLMARLAQEIVTWEGDYEVLLATAADLITEEIGDRVRIVLLDVPAPGDVLTVASTYDDARKTDQGRRLRERLGDDGLREWVHGFAQWEGRTHEILTRQDVSDRPAYVQVLREYREDAALLDANYALMRGPTGAVIGMVVSAREGSSEPFLELDRAALASAADALRMSLDLAATRAAQREAEEQRRSLLAELLTAEQAERQRIAQDVHDDALQLLVAAQLRLQLVPDSEAAAELVRSAQRSLRHLLLDLDPEDRGAPPPLAAMLLETAQLFFSDSDTQVTVSGELTDVSPEIAAVLHRAGREAISNARRHARARTVTIALDDKDGCWQLIVTDDGFGIADPPEVRKGHLGLRGMAVRIAAVGGTCSVRPGEDGGTVVAITVPYC